MKKQRTGSLKKRITLTMITVVIVMLLCVNAISLISIKNISDTLIDSNSTMSEISGKESSDSMTELTQLRMTELAANKAEIVDGVFFDFSQAVLIAAREAEEIYADPGAYAESPVALPDPANDGKLTAQILYASDTDPEDESIRQEALLLGNIQDSLIAINQNYEDVASNYIATESGIVVQADFISGRKFDENGGLMPLDAKERPWYKGAAAVKGVYFTPVTKDLHTPRLAIMCGAPVFCDGKLKAISGAGMYLDDIEAMVEGIGLGKSGNACVINQYGRILFSTYDEESLSTFRRGSDLLVSDDEDLSGLTNRAIHGESGLELLAVDDASFYVAFAPMKTVGWSLLIILDQDEVEAPTKELMESLGEIEVQAVADAQKHIPRTYMMFLIAMAAGVAVAILLSFILSSNIVRPIRTLADKVSKVEGDNLDFQWEMNTRDETQMLAESFETLTDRMKTYIDDIQTITAERERIGAELQLATRIQESMLPTIFPPFPERKEFDVFATMTPAKEVGGDFYDFYMIDDDHICLTIADVSGKGVPAALFMMATKIILQSNAMLGQSPAEILRRTNEAVCANNKIDMFVTVWVGILEISTGKLTAANAGHEYPFVKQNGRYEKFKDKHGFIIGGMEGMNYHDYTLDLEPGDGLFVYTDGVVEANDSERNMFGMERLGEVLNRDPGASCGKIIGNVKEAVDEFVQEAAQFDDLTMLCLEYRGPQTDHEPRETK